MHKTSTVRGPALVILAAGLLGAGAAACTTVAEPDPTPRASTTASSNQIPDPPELVKEDIKVGEGPEIKKGDKLKVKYTGKLLRTGFKFDSNDSFPVTVGEGVIEGWSQGLVGMKKGGQRKLTIPSRLAYGERGSPPKIPGFSPLDFVIELVQCPSGGVNAEAAKKNWAEQTGVAWADTVSKE